MSSVECPATRWAWVEIDLSAVRKNTRTLKGLLAPRTRLMCAVKADAYGHGAVECARIMRSAGADQFAVATVNEGVELRRAGIAEPILVLNETPLEALDLLLEHDIMPSVYTSEFAFAYGERAVACDKVGRYHLAIDTGMSRIGVMPADAVEFRHLIDFHRGLECAGTYTHFATADVVGDWDFRQQLNRFLGTVEALGQANFDCGLVHCDNTPGMVLHPEAHLDMCRAGIGLYGLQPAEATVPRVSLEPVMSVRGRVTRVAAPGVGEGVSYGLTYRISNANVQIATVPLGYADGLARELSNNMDVLVGGRRFRQVGRICMDQFMFAVDPSAVRPYRAAGGVEHGDVVTIMGADGDDAITADELAKRRNTINYEVTCNFGLRLQKVYV